MAARGCALFLGGFALLGLIGEARGRATDLGLWFVDLRDLAGPIQVLLLGGFGVALVAWSRAGEAGVVVRRGAALACLVIAGFAIRDVVRFGQVVGSGLVRPVVPIPLSLPIAAGLVALAVAIWRDAGLAGSGPRRVRASVVAAAVVAAVAFPVLQIGFFWTTDYRRPADAAIVFGARVYASGAPSPLLADRIATAVELYRTGFVKTLVMSGGVGADGFNEAEVMRDRAVAAGVDRGAILVDGTGITTEATVDHALTLLGGTAAGSRRLIAVSQAYHLPRIQLAFSGAGIDVLTVPAVDPVPISEMPLLVAREVPAFWLYYLRACLG